MQATGQLILVVTVMMVTVMVVTVMVVTVSCGVPDNTSGFANLTSAWSCLDAICHCLHSLPACHKSTYRNKHMQEKLIQH